MDIVWSCASAIILSTWSVLHLNLPPDLEARSRWEKVWKYVYLLQRKLGWMAIMLAFPEYFVGISVTNLFSAWVNHPALKKFAEEDDVDWSLTHTILANIGGLAVRFSDIKDGAEEQKLDKATNDQALQAATPPASHEQPGINQAAGESPASSVPSRRAARESGNISRDSDMVRLGKSSASHLEVGIQFPKRPGVMPDRDDSDEAQEMRLSPTNEDIPEFILKFERSQEIHLGGLGKIPWKLFHRHVGLAAHAHPFAAWLQKNTSKYRAEHAAPLSGNIWILDSKQIHLARKHGIISRLPSLKKEEINDKSKSDGLVRLLAVSQLFWLAIQLIARKIEHHPSSALEISTVAFSACAIIIYAAEWAKPKDVEVPFYIDTHSVVSPVAFSEIADAGPITFLQPRYYYVAQSCIHQIIEGRFTKDDVDRLMVVMTILSITLYGGIHLFAWSLHFPTGVERLLWRVSALTVAIAPTISALLVSLEQLVRHRTDKFSQWSVTVLAPAYLAARLYIIVESFRALYYLPRDAFIATWVANAPHVG